MIEAATPTGLRWNGAPLYRLPDDTLVTGFGVVVPGDAMIVAAVGEATPPKSDIGYPETFSMRTGVVDISKAPPIVTLEGWPALPGESARDYHIRVHDALLARQVVDEKRDMRNLITFGAGVLVGLAILEVLL